MITCGLTGGIGAGKSTVAGMLAGRGIPVIDTDEIARELVQPGEPALNDIQAQFGSGMIRADGCLDRERMAQLVFSDSDKRGALESILHPRIRCAWEERVSALRDRGTALAIVAIPLLFETGAEQSLHGVVCVGCSETTQNARLTQRGWSAAQIERRIGAQWPLRRKMDRADWVIWNESTLNICEEQLMRVMQVVTGPAD